MVVPPSFTLKAIPLPGAWGAEITGVSVSFQVNRSPSLSSGFASEQLSDLEQVSSTLSLPAFICAVGQEESLFPRVFLLIIGLIHAVRLSAQSRPCHLQVTNKW